MTGQLICMPKKFDDPNTVARRRMRHLMSLGRPVKVVNHAPPVSSPLDLSDDIRRRMRRVAGAALYIHIQNASFSG